MYIKKRAAQVKLTSTNLGFCWVLNVIDVYSKFAKAYPLKSKAALKVSNVLELLFLTFGPSTAL